MIASLLLLSLCVAADTWTVDDDGPADFSDIGAAVGQAAPGDTILVEQGTYHGFALDKQLTILGRAGGLPPRIHGALTIAARDGFTLAGFDVDLLQVTGVEGRGRVDDCRVNVLGDDDAKWAASIAECAQLVLSDLVVHGSSEYSKQSNGPGSALLIESSAATLVNVELTGAPGGSGASGEDAGPGGTALAVREASHVTVAGPMLHGGPGGISSYFTLNGLGGSGIEAKDSIVVVRGQPIGDGVFGGIGFYSTLNGYDLLGTNATFVVSGVSIGSKHLLQSSVLLAPAVAEPFVELTTSHVPGTHCSIGLHGPDGMVCLLAASLAPDLVSLGKYSGDLWLDPAQLLSLLPVVLEGQAKATGPVFALPTAGAGLEGLAIELQPVFPTFPGSLEPTPSLAGNIAELIVRF